MMLLGPRRLKKGEYKRDGHRICIVVRFLVNALD